jgi:hypothetical protein
VKEDIMAGHIEEPIQVGVPFQVIVHIQVVDIHIQVVTIHIQVVAIHIQVSLLLETFQAFD